MILCVDASACNGMLFRTGTGKVNHLSAKQLWVHGGAQNYGVEVQQVPRAEHASDILGVRIEGGSQADGIPHPGRTRGSSMAPLQCWAILRSNGILGRCSGACLGMRGHGGKCKPCSCSASMCVAVGRQVM